MTPHRVHRALAAVLAAGLTAAGTARSTLAAESSPIDLNPIGEDTLLCQGIDYRFYFTDADGNIPDPSFWEGATLTAELDPEEVREYTDTFEVACDADGRLYLAVTLSGEEVGLHTLRYKIAYQDAQGERWFLRSEAKALLEPADTASNEVFLYMEEEIYPREADDDSVQYLNPYRDEVIFHQDLEEVTLHFGSRADFEVRLGSTRRFLLGYDETLTAPLRQLLGERADDAQVLNFTGTPRFDSAGTLTIHSEKPYLYEFRDGQLILCDSVHSDGRHSITVQTLGCYVLLSSPL